MRRSEVGTDIMWEFAGFAYGCCSRKRERRIIDRPVTTARGP